MIRLSSLLLLPVFLLPTILVGEEFDPEKPTTAVTIKADKATLAYDTKKFTVKAGTKVKVTFVVPQDVVIPQPHNLVVVKKGKDGVVMQQAMQLMADPNGLAKGYLPDDKSDILAHTKMIPAGQTDEIEFEVPAEVGDYTYFCTFPGHFAIMKGVMAVVE